LEELNGDIAEKVLKKGRHHRLKSLEAGHQFSSSVGEEGKGRDEKTCSGHHGGRERQKPQSRGRAVKAVLRGIKHILAN